LQYTGNLERSLNVVSPYFDIGRMHSESQTQNGRVIWHAYNRCEGS